MSVTQATNVHAAQAPSVGAVDTKLEVVVLPVADAERAKRFYGGLGWRLDADFSAGEDWRALQMTPPGSPCSIIFGKGVTTAVPGSAQGLFLIVDDIEAARAELIRHGADVSEAFHFEGPLMSSGRKDARRARTRKVAPTSLGLVQRSRRQRLAAPGGQDAASRTRIQHRTSRL